MIEFLSVNDAFSSGGNRLVFVDPEDQNRCIKLARPERSPESKKLQKGWLGKFRTTAYFDENVSDMSVYRHIQRQIGDSALSMIPNCYGYVETNLGRGLAYELIRDETEKISLTLKQYVWENGCTEALKETINAFLKEWQKLGMPSRNLLLHNIVVQQNRLGNVTRLVVIDGLGWPDFLPLAYFFRPLARWKSKRKSARLISSIEQLLTKKQQNGDWGLRGWLDDEQRQ
jgi:hypothetical protein